jgi:hypothetical protein
MTGYWNECEKHTGAATIATAEKIGVKGAWTLKSRGEIRVLVGCLTKATSEFAENATKDAKGRPAVHVTVCDHRRVRGAASRKGAIELAKKSHEWCAICRGLTAAL